MIAPDKTIILGLLILRSWKHAMQGLRKITFSSSLSLQGPVLTLWSNHEFLWLDHMLNCQFRKIKTKTLYSLLCNCVTTMILYVCYRNSRCTQFFFWVQWLFLCFEIQIWNSQQLGSLYENFQRANSASVRAVPDRINFAISSWNMCRCNLARC